MKRKYIEHLIYEFLEFCNSDPECGLYLEEFNGKEKKIINNFLDEWLDEKNDD